MLDITNVHNWSGDDWARALHSVITTLQPILNERIKHNELLSKYLVFTTILNFKNQETMILINVPEDGNIFEADRLVSLRVYRALRSIYSRAYSGPALDIEAAYIVRHMFPSRHYKTRSDGTINIEKAADFAIEIAEAAVRHMLNRHERKSAHEEWLADLRENTRIPWDEDGNLDYDRASYDEPTLEVEPAEDWRKDGFTVNIKYLKVPNEDALIDLLSEIGATVSLIQDD